MSLILLATHHFHQSPIIPVITGLAFMLTGGILWQFVPKQPIRR